jgi:hypothetical protein
MAERPKTLFSCPRLRSVARELKSLSDRIVRVCNELERASIAELSTRNASSLQAGLERLRAFVQMLETAGSDAVVYNGCADESDSAPRRSREEDFWFANGHAFGSHDNRAPSRQITVSDSPCRNGCDETQEGVIGNGS